MSNNGLLSRRAKIVAVLALLLFTVTIVLLGRLLTDGTTPPRAPVAVKPNASMVQDHFGVEVNGHLTPELVDIPAGSFLMGSGAEIGSPQERPQHKVTLTGFKISRFEITNVQYLAFCKATDHTPPNDPRWAGSYLASFPDHPVVNIRWQDGVDYCQWLSTVLGKKVRLPTEAEWEYAAQGSQPGTTSELSASESVPTTRVGSHAPNRFGLYDMLGNVWEWCGDWYAGDYYLNSPESDPTGPESGKFRVIRGGSWADKGEQCRISKRSHAVPDGESPLTGFRIVVSEK